MKSPSLSAPLSPSPNLGTPNLGRGNSNGSGSRSNSRSTSPNLPHRPSTSSNRSLKRSEADFEAALLDHKSTIFLSASGSSTLDEDTNNQFIRNSNIGLGPSPSLRKRLDNTTTINGDPDQPLPIEKTSFEEDLNNLKNSSSIGTGLGILMESPERKINHKNIDIIPPTPSTINTTRHNRKSSQLTNDSGYQSSNYSDSTSINTNSRRRTSKSIGIDAELGEIIKPKNAMPPKRRSIFRSPGTASSPDLATLVRKAKEAKTTTRPDEHPSTSQQAQQQSQPPASAGPTTTTTPIKKVNNSRPGTAGSARQPTLSPAQSFAESSTTTLTSNSRNRERSTTNPKVHDEQWGRYGSMLGGNQMASIAEGSGTISSSGRSRTQSSDEGFKSIRNKAKGVFGKMFGSSKDHPLPSTTPPSATSSRFPETDSPRPPVPPVPSAYTSKLRKAPDPPDQLRNIPSGIDHPPSSSRTVSSSTIPASRESSAIYDGRRSITPTNNRRVSGNSHLSIDKPLPAVMEPEEDPRRTPSTSLRVSGHTRQPASAADDDSPPGLEPPLKPTASPGTRTVHTFKSDMAGMLEDIGQTDPAKDLGLPVDSIRGNKDRTSSMETARETARSRFPSELGRNSKDTSSHLSPIPTQRTSSLPIGSPQLDRIIPKRTTSSPSPNPSLNGDSGLVPHPQMLSRTSSRSSGRRSAQSKSPANSNLPSPARSPSLSHGKKSFDRSQGQGDSPLIPSSVRLVSSPPPQESSQLYPNIAPLNLNDDGTSKSSFMNSSPWGKQTPRTMSAPGPIYGNKEDQLEIVNTPPDTPRTTHEEDEEEKGRRLACEFLEEDFTNVPGDKVAEFLGGPRAINAIALKYYMQYFDMKGQTLVDSFRDLCQKLHLKAESQEIDRILEAFSARYFECNGNTVFGTPGVVHTVTAAMLMLNTDLHIAELNKHMSRTDFVRNAMRAIHESMPSGDRSSTPDLIRDDSSSIRPGFGSNASMAPSLNTSVRSKNPANPPSTQRSASAPVIVHAHGHAGPTRTDSLSSIGTNGLVDTKTRGSSTTVSSFTYNKAWELEAENALREIFASVKADRILLPISGNQTSSSNNRQSMISISSNGPFERGKSVRSPSDRVNVLKRGSIRGMQGLLNNPYGSQWSASDGRLSPTPSYATSINEGLGSFAPTLGFASNLSHTVIREHDDEVRSIDSNTSDDTTEDMDDDELALLGAPWAKEGLLSRKLYWESTNKRAKKNDWKQFFVVISKGELYMFTFGEKGGNGGFMGGSVGGGNWLENANANGQISLMHTMSVALPKPGYNANRPYCFSLATPTGETSFFQAGTEDLVMEWVSACNYWAARRSRQPLQGGVSNMEYGWNRIPLPGEEREKEREQEDDRASIKSSRSNLSKLGGTYGKRTLGSISSSMNDKIYINDWKPPPPATMPSPLDEESQLDALQNYVRSLVDELEQHKSIEEPMNKLYTPGSKDLIKARENWKAKSHYIHTEIFKYETYVESLRNAISLRVKKQGEKKLEKSLARSMTSLHRRSSQEDNDQDEDDDEEEEEGEEFELTLRKDELHHSHHKSMDSTINDELEEQDEEDGFGTPNPNDNNGTIRR
ncbi:uncharacterized protein L201_002180 [Kwoniella dendrophila CBS 6074]|uniref:SEC7 domain-containing protein n=1 Tax=Kwoniella dendrophila CBS 6074 TaxID=1295534 RepID=A0AAX4JPG6_9TREE